MTGFISTDYSAETEPTTPCKQLAVRGRHEGTFCELIHFKMIFLVSCPALIVQGLVLNP